MTLAADQTSQPEEADPKRRLKASHVAGLLVAVMVCIAAGFSLGFLFPDDRSFAVCEYVVRQELSGVAAVSGRRVSDREIELSFEADDTSGVRIERSPGTARCEFSGLAWSRDAVIRRMVVNGRYMRPDAIEAAMADWAMYRR